MTPATAWPRTMRAARLAFGLACCLGLVVPATLFFVWSVRWPLVGDASLIHYIVFLIERGWAPYRDLGDMNMPGSFLIEMAAMRVFGMGDLGWRLFDFALMLAASASFWVVCRPQSRVPHASPLHGDAWDRATEPGGPSLPASSERAGLSGHWFPTLFAACLFVVIHGRDGLAEGGQRDLTMAVCLIAGTALLFLAVRSGRRYPRLAYAFGFGLLCGMALTIKPTAALCGAGELVLAALALRRHQRPLWPVLTSAAGALIAPAVAVAFLVHEKAFPSFLVGFTGIIPYYASLGHRPLGFLILHSISPLLPLVLLWIALILLLRPAFSLTDGWERSALMAGVAFGFFSCIVQARGLPYYRYPLLAFLLPLIAIDADRALLGYWPNRLRTRATQALALMTLATGSLIVAPQSALVMHRFRPREIDFISTLQARLQPIQARLEAHGDNLSHRIQCIDSISGCGNVLYRMRLEPATGVLSDFLLFGPPDVPVIRQTREDLSRAIVTRPPEVIVITSHLHMDGPDGYRKLDRWPAFQTFLATRYTLDTEWAPTRTARWWSREETPAGYRIYRLRPEFEPNITP